MKIKQRVWIEKLMTARSILCQDDSLARQVYDQQLAMGWPGLSSEVRNICKQVGLEDLNVKMQDKEVLKEAVFYHNYMEMKDDMQKYKKLERIRHEDFRNIPEYIIREKSIEKVRLAYRIRTNMINDIKTNYKNSHISSLQCDWCDSGADESQCHVERCDGWEEERRGLDMGVLDDLVFFFQRILKRKSEKKKEGLLLG